MNINQNVAYAGLLSEEFVVEQLRRQDCKFLIHIALPKSGSTWLTSVMERLYINRGWKKGVLVPAYGRRNQEIDPRLFFVHGQGQERVFAGHQHCPFSEYTKKIIECTNSEVVFQFRNIYDVIVSYTDHLLRITQIESRHEIVPRGVESLNKNTLLDYVIDVEAPWLIKFMEGWMNSGLLESDNFCPVSYESMLNNPKSVIKSISYKFNLDFTDTEIESALEYSSKQNTRKNVAVIGRGRTTLTKNQIQRIDSLLSFFNIYTKGSANVWDI